MLHQTHTYPRHTTVIISQSRTLAVVPHMTFGYLAFVGAFVDSESYTSPIFASLFIFLGLQAWGALFGLCGILATICVVTRSFRSYMLTNSFTMLVSMSWFIALLKGRFVDGYVVSTLGLALWVFLIVSCFINALVPINVINLEGRAGSDSPGVEDSER